MSLRSEAAFAVAERERQNWFVEKRKLDEAVAENSAVKRALPDNYWQREHLARRRTKIATEVATAILEAEKDGATIDG